MSPAELETAGKVAVHREEDVAEPDAIDRRNNPRLDVATGIFTIVTGGALWLGTRLLALNGGVYIVAWGPIAYGIVRLTRGLRALR